MSKQHINRINKDRKSQAEVRRARMQKLSALGMSAPEIAETEKVAVGTVYNNLSLARKETPIKVDEIRTEADVELRKLLAFILQSEEMSDGEIVREIRATWESIRDLHGADAPSKSIVGHVSGPQLDALYLDIRQVLLRVDEADRHEGLELLQEWAKTKIRPVVVDGMALQPIERSLTDGDLS